ncbi:uncharacterized protein LOC131252106 [Magnolia sinica]|uniref:uncharacterized protein LOC131252106 n=1 Tax=Magnolia sinica TaxID=86752 RepID=UPI00265B666A|nr:uncharacterized protein LOC131252106 [Magnolia sinica]
MVAALHHQLGDTDEPNDGNASVKKRTNVLLLGDHLGDLGMSDGLNYENQIVVGFLRFPAPAFCETATKVLVLMMVSKIGDAKNNHLVTSLLLNSSFRSDYLSSMGTSAIRGLPRW